jgi:RimJ/RimL family protein N-acetyltransferase
MTAASRHAVRQDAALTTEGREVGTITREAAVGWRPGRNGELVAVAAPLLSDGAPRGVPGMREPAVRLFLSSAGILDDDIVVRLPRAEDVDELMPAFADPALREAGNLPRLGRNELLETLPHLPRLAAAGRLLPIVVADARLGHVLGGGALHHLDAERGIVELGYWLFPHARGRGIATRLARLLAEHAFTLGVERVAAYVNVGNGPSERVLERAGFTREGVIRSLPKPDGTRVDKTLYSLLPGE